MSTLDEDALARVAARVSRWDGDQQSLNEMAFRRQSLMEIYEDLLFLHHTVKLSRPDAQIRRAKFYQGAICTAGPTRHPDVPEYCIKFSSSRNCVACALFRRRNPESYPDHVPSSNHATAAHASATAAVDTEQKHAIKAKRRRPAPSRAAMETDSDSEGERKTQRKPRRAKVPRSPAAMDRHNPNDQQEQDENMEDTHQQYQQYTAGEYQDDDDDSTTVNEEPHDPLLSLSLFASSPALKAMTMEDAAFASGEEKRPRSNAGSSSHTTPTLQHMSLSLPPYHNGTHTHTHTHIPSPRSLTLPPPFKLHRSMSATGSAPGSAPGSGTSSGATTARSMTMDDHEMAPQLADVPPTPPAGMLSPSINSISRSSNARARSRSDATPEMLPHSGSFSLSSPPPASGNGSGIPLARSRSGHVYDTYAVQLRNGLTMLIGVDARGALYDPVIPSMAYSRAMSQDSGTAAASTSTSSSHSSLTLSTSGSASPQAPQPLPSPTEAWFQAIAKQNDQISQSQGTPVPIPVEAALSDHILLSPKLGAQASPMQKPGMPPSPLPLRLNTGTMGMDVDAIALQLSKRAGINTVPTSTSASTHVHDQDQHVGDAHSHQHYSHNIKASPTRMLPAH